MRVFYIVMCCIASAAALSLAEWSAHGAWVPSAVVAIGYALFALRPSP